MAQVVEVSLPGRTYGIHIGGGLLGRAGALAAGLVRGRRTLLVSDGNVDPLYGAACEGALAGAGFAVRRAVVPAGENTKSGPWLFHLYDEVVKAGLDRHGCVVALGGGVVGDLAGFLAATYMRGVALVQLPTSLLAMVDSAVGGKTGINLAAGKNLVGSFHQPALVVCDLDALRSLPRREFASGLAEVVKYGVIRDPALFALLEAEAERILQGDPELLERLVARSCQIKAEVVGADERESGLRAILNFGHTVGHAIEAVAGYGRFLHGEAVAIGMVFAANLSASAAGLPAADAARVAALLRRLALPVRAPDCAWADLRAAMEVDKKSAGGRPRFVLATRLGEVAIGCEVADDALAAAWEAL